MKILGHKCLTGEFYQAFNEEMILTHTVAISKYREWKNTSQLRILVPQTEKHLHENEHRFKKSW